MEVMDVNDKGEHVYVDTDKHAEYTDKIDNIYNETLDRYMKERGYQEKPLPTFKQLSDRMHSMKRMLENMEKKISPEMFDILFGIHPAVSDIKEIERKLKNREYVDINDKEALKYSNQYKIISDGFSSSKEYKELFEVFDKLYDDMEIERPAGA